MTAMTGGSDPLISIEGLTRTYLTEAETVWAVRDATLTADAGEFVCIFGASGSGKSTFLNIVAGLDVADSGTVRVAGKDVAALDEVGRADLRMRSVGVVFQDHNLIDEFTALENVALPLEVRGLPRAEASVAASRELSRVGLDGLADRYPHQLSGGQRQRVGIARALVGDRKVLLADEPTGALDSRNSRALFQLIRQLCDNGTLAIVCSHDLACQEYADSVFEMVDGQVLPRSRAVV